MMNNMKNNFDETSPGPNETEKSKRGAKNSRAQARNPGSIARWINSLVQMGLGESLLQVGTNLFSIVAIVIVILLAQAYYRQTPARFQ